MRAHNMQRRHYPAHRLVLSLAMCGLLTSANARAEIELVPFSGYRLSGEFKDVNSDTTLDVDDTSLDIMDFSQAESGRASTSSIKGRDDASTSARHCLSFASISPSPRAAWDVF